MRSFVNVAFDVGAPMAVLLVSSRQVQVYRRVMGLVQATPPPVPGNDSQESLTRLAVEVERLVEHLRPDLKGVSVVGVHMRGGLCWEITAVHPSFARTAWHSSPPEVALVDGDDVAKPHVVDLTGHVI